MSPVFIPSKGRAKNCATHRNFETYGMHDWMYVVEPQEYWDYVQRLRRDGVYKPETHVYAFDLETFKSPKSKDNPLGFDYLDDYGWRPDLTTGPGPARNALHQLAKKLGCKHYWMLDDDISSFAVDAFFFQKNVWTKDVTNGGAAEVRMSLIDSFDLYERFLDMYSNIGLAEFEKQGLVQNHRKNSQFSVNCKTYSCIRFSTEGPDIPWRSRYNDDVMISLDYEKRGFVNVSSKIVCYQTPDTQSQAGGMTEAFHQEGTLRKVKYLVKAYPEHTFFTLKFGRFHHLVDYSKFEQTLHLKNGQPADLDQLTPASWNPDGAFQDYYLGYGSKEFQAKQEEARALHWKNVDDLLMAVYADRQIDECGYCGTEKIPIIRPADLRAADVEGLLGLKRKHVDELGVKPKPAAKKKRSKQSKAVGGETATADKQETAATETMDSVPSGDLDEGPEF